jgi:enoyl-CoA hydratase/carnithine racemase
MPEGLVTYALETDVALIGLNRTDKRNALSRQLSHELDEAARRAHREARAAVIFSHGDTFCAGLDLKEAADWMATPEMRFRSRMLDGVRPFESIANSPIPFIAAIAGACVGGGLEMASACHLRVADETGYFALPEGQRGIYVGGGGSVTIARILGVGRMTDMMLTGRVLNADEAERAGLVQHMAERGGALALSKKLAARIAENAPMTNWAICNGLRRIQNMSSDDGLFMEGLVALTVNSPESQTRLRDFIEKRTQPLRPNDA